MFFNIFKSFEALGKCVPNCVKNGFVVGGLARIVILELVMSIK